MKLYQKVLMAIAILITLVAVPVRYNEYLERTRSSIVVKNEVNLKQDEQKALQQSPKEEQPILEKQDVSEEKEISSTKQKEQPKQEKQKRENNKIKSDRSKINEKTNSIKVKEDTNIEQPKEETKGEKVESMGLKEDVKGAVFSAMGTAPTISVVEGDGESYLTNRLSGVLVKVKYPGDGTKTIKIGSEAEKEVSKSDKDYQYVLRVASNETITAKNGNVPASYNVDNIVKIDTGCKAGTEGYVKSKTYYSAILGGIITNSKGVEFTTTNTKELGIRYWRDEDEMVTDEVQESQEIYTVSTTSLTPTTSGKGVVSNSDGTIKFELKATSLKENSTYYMQAYMINSKGEILLGDVKEFSTLGHGIGLYGLYYSGSSDTTPKLIKQETNDRMTVNVGGVGQFKKVRWMGEIAPLNSGLMKFKITSDANVTINIVNGENESLTVSSSATDKTVTTSKIYELGKKYPIEIIATKSSNISNVRVEWQEDLTYQEIHKEQLYPKEYVKMESAVINSKGTDGQEVFKTTGEYIKKKVITNGQVIKTFSLNTDSTVATITKMDNSNLNVTIDGTISDGHAKLEAWLVYKDTKVIEPLTENVQSINYNTKKVTLKDNSIWNLYEEVEVVGRIMILSSSKEYTDVYDLGRYITNAANRRIIDEYSTNTKTYKATELYRADPVDNTYILNVYDTTATDGSIEYNKAYREALIRYSDMEKLVEDSKPVDRWNLGIGETRLYSIVPIRLVLSFDGDDSFDMQNPVIRINKNLFKNKLCTTADTVFKLSMPTDARDSGTTNKITSLYYGDWRYMGETSQKATVSNSNTYQENNSIAGTGTSANPNTNVNSAKGGTITIEEETNTFKITLNNYKARKVVSSGSKIGTGNVSQINNNIVVNVLLRADSINNQTSDEVFATTAVTNRILNNAYRTYTKASVEGLKENSGSFTTATQIKNIPIEIKIKEQVSFE